jgi:hypothetical protein
MPCCRDAEALGASIALDDGAAADSEAALVGGISTWATVAASGADLFAEGIAALGCTCVAVPTVVVLADGRIGAVGAAAPELARCAQPVRTKPSKSQVHR